MQFSMAHIPNRDVKSFPFVFVRNQKFMMLVDLKSEIAYKLFESQYPFDTWSYDQIKVDIDEDGYLNIYVVEQTLSGLVRKVTLQKTFIKALESML
jgi:hypothetical protein